MRLTWTRLRLELAEPFRTAAATRTVRENLWVRLDHEGTVGWGEAAPVDTYSQTVESAEGVLATLEPLLGNDPFRLERIIHRLLPRFDDQCAAVAAVDAALHDWIAKRLGIPTTRYLGLDPAQAPPTSFTLGIDEPAKIADKVRRAAPYPILKIKLGTEFDEEILSTVRSVAPKKTLRVDANRAWSVEEALDKLPMLAAHGVEFLEQPIPAGDPEGLRRLKDAGICPIVADESCVRPADIAPLAGCVDGINIKLSKCGGIREATKMIHIARGLGMKVMLGCMVESSLGIAAAAALAPLADWLDLDGHLLLARDPFTGIGGAGGRLQFGTTPGLGCRPADG